MAAFYFHGLRNFPGAILCPGGTNDPTDNGTDRMTYVNAPVTVKSSNGTIGVVYQVMSSNGDTTTKYFELRTSTNGGNTWGPPINIYERASFSGGVRWMNMGALGPDGGSRIWFLFTVATGTANVASSHTIWGMYSDDPDLQTWSSPTELTSLFLDSGTYEWCIVGSPGKIIQLQGGDDAGRLVVPFYNRAVIGGTWPDNAALLGLAYNDDGSTWVRGGMIDTGEADNLGAHETSISELRTSDGTYTGRIYANSRVVRTPEGNQPFRTHVVIDDPTTTLPDLKVMTYNGTDYVPSQATSASQICDSSGRIVIHCNLHGSDRVESGVWTSNVDDMVGDDPEFTFRRMVLPQGAYSDLRETSQNNYRVIAMTTNARENEAGTNEYMGMATFNWDWLASSLDELPEVFDWHFNERTSGLVPTRGCPIFDHGPFHFHMQGSGNAAVSWDADGIVSTGAGSGLMVCAGAANDGIKGSQVDWRLDDITQVFRMKVATDLAAGDNVIWDNRDNGTGRGVTIKVLATTRYLQVSCSHTGSNEYTATYSTNIADGEWYTWYIVRDVDGNAVQIYRVTDAGVVTSGTASGGAAGTIAYGQQARLLSASDGSDPAKANISRMKFIRGVAYTTGDMVPLTGTKETPSTLSGYASVVSPTLPASSANLVMSLAPTWDGMYSCKRDQWGGYIWGGLPVAGEGIGSFRDTTGDRLFLPENGRPQIRRTDGAGWMIRQPFTASTSITGMRTSNESSGAALADTSLDYVQNTRSASIAFIARWNASTGGTQYALLNRVTSGLQIFRTDAGAVGMNLQTGAGTIISNSSIVTGIALDTDYYFAFDYDAGNLIGNGAEKVTLYYGAYTAGNTPPTLTSVVVSGTMTARAAGAAGALYVGSGSTGSTCSDWLFSNVNFFDAPLGVAEHQAWADVAVRDAVFGSGSGGSSGGIGIGMGIGI